MQGTKPLLVDMGFAPDEQAVKAVLKLLESHDGYVSCLGDDEFEIRHGYEALVSSLNVNGIAIPDKRQV